MHRQGWSHPPPTTAHLIHSPLTHHQFTALLQADFCGTDTGSTAVVLARAFSPHFSMQKEQSRRVGLPGVSASRPLVAQDWADPALLARAAAPRVMLRVAVSAELLTRPREVPSGPQRTSALAPRRKLPDFPLPGEAVGRKWHTVLSLSNTEQGSKAGRVASSQCIPEWAAHTSSLPWPVPLCVTISWRPGLSGITFLISFSLYFESESQHHSTPSTPGCTSSHKPP